MGLTATELRAIVRAEWTVESPSFTTQDDHIQLKTTPRPLDYHDKEYLRGSWSPGKGTGPIMSNEEVEALPDYSDAEEDLIR